MSTFQEIFDQGFNITDVTILKETYFALKLRNGLTILVPLHKFKRLRDAENEELQNWKLVSVGLGVSWASLDEDISIKGILSELQDQLEDLHPAECGECNMHSQVLECV